MKECLFCRIIKGEIPSYKIWEDDKYMAFLDINPEVKGKTLVVPKEHQDSYLFSNTEENINGIIMASKEVAKLLENAFEIERVIAVAEGLEVNHLHIKLYPVHYGETQSVLKLDAKRANDEELKGVFELIKSRNS